MPGSYPAPDCANSDGSKSVKDLLKFLKAQTKTEEFDAIKIASGLARHDPFMVFR
nr:DNA-directed RNA polymerase subunit beta' [Raoultella sp. NCTC 9187]